MAEEKSESGTINFEQALTELEKIVKELEGGSLSLEKSLELFERGVKLARLCKEKLAAAELKITKLVKEKEGVFNEEPFESEN